MLQWYMAQCHQPNKQPEKNDGSLYNARKYEEEKNANLDFTRTLSNSAQIVLSSYGRQL